MNLIPLMLDCRPDYASAESAASLLALPLGYGSVLDSLVHRLAGLHRGEVSIVSADGEVTDYGRCLHGPNRLRVRVLAPDQLPAAFDGHEASDYVFVFDTRYWPVRFPSASEISRGFDHYRGATHGIAVGSNLERATERIECDSNGCIRRVQRLYDAKSWPDVAGDAIVYSIVPAPALAGLRFETLGELRRQLNLKGVLSRDVPVVSDVLDLTCERAFLNLTEQALLETTSRELNDAFTALRPGVLVGPRCSVHISARLIPPILIQAGSRIEAGATIVGPAVIGAGCRVEPDAIVAQAVLREDTHVPAKATIRQRVVSDFLLRPVDGETGPINLSPSAGAAGDWLRVPNSGISGLSQSLDPVPRVGRTISLALKRIHDAVLVAVGLVLLSPVLAAAAAAIKIESRGPIFFCHRREGKGGKEFPCIKFRTMVADAHSKQLDLYKNSQVDGPQFKLDRDPRVTRVGHWLRGMNIDELPQLINVLVGQMSLVGPRPSPFRENQICVQWRRARLSVRPGITGLWQICRDKDRSRGGFHEWIYYDIAYVRHFSLWLDVKIILATLHSLGGRRSVPLHRLVRTEIPIRHERNKVIRRERSAISAQSV